MNSRIIIIKKASKNLKLQPPINIGKKNYVFNIHIIPLIAVRIISNYSSVHRTKFIVCSLTFLEVREILLVCPCSFSVATICCNYQDSLADYTFLNLHHCIFTSITTEAPCQRSAL